MVYLDPYQVDETDDKCSGLVTVEPIDIIKKCFPVALQQFFDAKAGMLCGNC